MQSTPSRAKHSTSILAPLINVDIFCFASNLVLHQKNRPTTKKAIGWFHPADGLQEPGFRLAFKRGRLR
jgi:hypothetical protein